MIKGVSKRVVVVKSPDPELFEEAIFIIREDVFRKPEANAERVLKEAQKAADGYLKNTGAKARLRLSRFPAPFFAAAGAAATGIAWLALRLVGV